MTRYSLLKQFFRDVYDNLPECGTLEDAYEATEDEYIKKNGTRTYKNFDSFRSAKCYHWQKGQHIVR